MARRSPAAAARRHSGGGARKRRGQPSCPAGVGCRECLPASAVAAPSGAAVAVSPAGLEACSGSPLYCGKGGPAPLIMLCLSPPPVQFIVARRGSGGTAALPRLLQHVMTRHTAAALQEAGHAEEAAALRTAAKLCRKAAAAAADAAEEASSGGSAAAALASVARQRADFWRAARRPWKVGQGLVGAQLHRWVAPHPRATHIPLHHGSGLSSHACLRAAPCSPLLAGCPSPWERGTQSWATLRRCQSSGGTAFRSTGGGTGQRRRAAQEQQQHQQGRLQRLGLER